MLILLLACASPPEDSAAPWLSPDQPGPYGVGAETLTFTDARGKDLVLEVWYPAVVDPDSEPEPYPGVVLTKQARREVPEDRRGGPYPLIGFSHGMGGIRYQSVTITEHLASHGFVTVAPDHEGNTFMDLDPDRTLEVFLDRPQDVQAAMQHMLELEDHPRLSGLVDPDRLGVMGHSFGAWTALVVGGGEVDLSGIPEWCEDNSGQVCKYLDVVGDDIPVVDFTLELPISTTVPLSPGVWYSFHQDGSGLSSVVNPLLMAGDKDQVLDYVDEVLPTYAALSSPKQMGTLADAGHYAYTDICLIAAPLFDDCEEEAGGWISMDRAHEISTVVLAAHFMATLGEDVDGEDVDAWLGENLADEIPELSWVAD